MRTAFGILVILLTLSITPPLGACINDGDSGRYERSQQGKYGFVAKVFGSQWGAKEWSVVGVGLLGGLFGGAVALRLAKQSLGG